MSMAKLGRVLVAVDFSPASKAALRYALRLAKHSEQPLTVLHVWEADGDEGAREALARAHKAMDAVVQEVNPDGKVTLNPRFERGAPSVAIALVASMESYDLLIVGAHGWSGRWHLRLGATAETLVSRAPCPVLTVFAPDPDEAPEGDVPWPPRDAARTQRLALEFPKHRHPGDEPLATLEIKCPLTGAKRSGLECITCERFVAGCINVGAGAFEIVCRTTPAVGKDRPAVGKDQPLAGKDQPLVGKDTPAAGKDLPRIG
jgi:universal stress protein A